jgi:hypothetical protein
MELTSRSLVALSAITTVLACTALIVFWRRLARRAWPLVRVVGILLCEALLIFTVALQINRADDFYPSWSALLGGDQTRDLPRAPAASLSGWLASKAAEGARSGLAFTWRSSDAAWRLPQPPIVYLPPAYFRQPGLMLPVIVVLAPPALTAAQGAWDDPAPAALAHDAGVSAGLILLRADAHLNVTTLAATLPQRLLTDVRVAPHGWGVTAIGAAIPAGLDLLRLGSDRFGPLALVPSATTAVNPLWIKTARDEAGALLAPSHLPGGAGRRSVATGSAVVSPALVAALRWVFGQMPPALAPPMVLPPYQVPVTEPVLARPSGGEPWWHPMRLAR